jgi:hypothetical protein
MYIPLSKRYRHYAHKNGAIAIFLFCGWTVCLFIASRLTPALKVAGTIWALGLCGNIIFGIGRLTREYYVDENGITAVWLKRWERRYSWSDFVAVERMIVFSPGSFNRVDCVVCTMIPPKILPDTYSAPYPYVTIDWTDAHPFKVLDIPLTEEQREEFWRYVPASLHPTPDNHTD